MCSSLGAWERLAFGWTEREGELHTKDEANLWSPKVGSGRTDSWLEYVVK